MTDASDLFAEAEGLPPHERLILVELVGRVLDRGVVIRGDLLISIEGIDLIYLGLRLVLSGVDTLGQPELYEGTAGPPLPPAV